MIIIAASLYLPEHISTIMRRASFYWAGDEAAVTQRAGHLGGKMAETMVAKAGSGEL
jgi:hypothetical protein